MIDPNSLLPPTSDLKSTEGVTEAQGVLSFPALSAKEAQGKVETQTRKVSVSGARLPSLCARGPMLTLDWCT